MDRWIARALLGAALMLSVARAAEAVVVPPNFTVENAVPGPAFDTPTSICFLPDGRMLVAEKRGAVFMVVNGTKLTTPVWVRENEVLNDNDRGLLCVARDPKYFLNHFIYLLFTVDPDSNGMDSNNEAFGRLVRYQMSVADSNVVNLASRTVLLGTKWTDGPIIGSPSHTIGAIRWGRDGSMLVSAGEGADFTVVDAGGLQPNMFGPGKADPFDDIGAYRSQYIGTLAGKILRINPANGHGYASNPYANSNLMSAQSRVWEYGLRNPFRFTVRPNTGSTDTSAANPGVLYIGDVGWNAYEEMNVAATGGKNFGWPCYEGLGTQSEYANGPFPAHHGCGTIGTGGNPGPLTAPLATWHHGFPDLSVPPGFKGNCSIGGVFYTDTLYPGTFRNQYFFGDYGQNWLKVAIVDSLNHLVQIQDFGTNLEGPVDFATNPLTGDIHYVSILTGQVRRIKYIGPGGGNTNPVANASAAPSTGLVPLTVTFSSLGSYDPDGDPITYFWDFDDGQTSTAANPVHTYMNSGSYNATLIVNDGRGGTGQTTVLVIVAQNANFPTTGILDNFNRVNGAIGGQWVDQTSALQVRDSGLVELGLDATTVWNGGTFGPDQEAYFTLKATTPSAPEHDLMLKVQGLSWNTGHIEVRYDASQSRVQLSSYAPGPGWAGLGIIQPVTLQPGDQFGARIYSNGVIEVFQNGVKIGDASAAGWPYVANGGHVGMTIVGASSSILDNYGGGNWTPTFNTPPTAQILAPIDSSFFATADTIWLHGTGTDSQDPAGSLGYRWEMDLHHNTHIHPNSYISTNQNDFMIGANHDDGTGVFERVRLIVTDTGGLKDTTSVDIFPSTDLEASPVTVSPDPPGTSTNTLYSVVIRNKGPMPAPISHWQLRAGGTTLMQGDTVVAALDSVVVARVLPPTLAAGNYDLRLVADTLHTVVETDESNNANTRLLTVISGGPTSVDTPPLTLSLSDAYPNPSAGDVGFALSLPRPSPVRFVVHDLQGREVWSARERTYLPGRWTLGWNGEVGGARARPGLYFATVRADGMTLRRRFALIR